ncbi:AbrB/MazE/SpoVT family DNA-binding domain-containing protein [Levilactobacillus andaensis]|uniref:AbrB/MazE/SpoVT family DNA-binding domain-containing protein n=1 Tax=Levilactobacillus andaensis TaxID=2799570 RepID=UPI001943A05B|nr:AbrB/MazE/SpoVT family DNA-binding domain-containing protein [Levilactobacillus andaensis]
MTVVKISGKGQVVIPAAIRQSLDLTAGDRLNVTVVNGRVVMEKLPVAAVWREIVAQIPVEQVVLDEAGHYDVERAPHFDHWLRSEK